MAVFQVRAHARLGIACKQFPQLVVPAFPSSPGGQDGVTGWYGVQRSGARGAALAAPTAHCPLPSRSVFFFDITCRMSSTTAQQLGTATARVVQQVEAAAQRLALCRRAFSESLTEAAALNDAQTRLYKMDVGGALFHSHTEVLHRHGGMLSAMASSDFSHDMEGAGYAFIDRDPAWFPLVLHFMRTGAALLPDDAAGRAAVLREARFYSLEGLYQAAQRSPERLFGMGYEGQWYRAYAVCVMYTPLRGRIGFQGYIDVDEGVLSFGAADGCLFALLPRCPLAHRAGFFPRFPPATGGWRHIATAAYLHNCNPWVRFCAYDRGHLYWTFHDRVQSLHMSNRRFEDLPRLSQERVGATLCVLDGRLFVIGGLTASVEEYVELQRRWVSVPDMPRAVDGAAAVALDGKLLVIRGRRFNHGFDFDFFSAVLGYNPGDRSWKELPRLHSPRSFCRVTVFGGDVVVIGGCDASGFVEEVERYNRQSQCWEAMARVPEPLFRLAATVDQV